MPSANDSDADAGTTSPDAPISGDQTDLATNTPDAEGSSEARSVRTGGPHRLNSETARLAGLKSAEARRRRERLSQEAVQAASDGRVIISRVPVAIGDIVARLSADARKGDVGAARELRAYLEAFPVEDETDLAALDRRVLQEMKARLLAEIAADEAAASTIASSSAPTADPQEEGHPGEAGTPKFATA